MVIKEISDVVKKMYKEGIKDENFVMEAVSNTLGGSCKKSSEFDDMRKHIDFWWESPKKGTIGIDVKGLNKNRRKDSEYSDNHWIEVKNVNGNKGWIYGEAKYIAFRTKTNILFVEPKDLIDVYINNVSNKKIVFDTPDECYIPYQRKKWGRKDISFKMPDKDIELISKFIIQL